MTKIKENIRSLFIEQRTNIKNYAGTFISIGIIVIVFLFSNVSTQKFQFYYTMIFMAISSFTLETITKNWWQRITLYILAFIMSIISSNIIDENIDKTLIVLIVVGVYISFTLIAIYKIVSDSNLTMSQFLTRVFRNSLIVSIIYLILEIGLNMVLAIALLLIFRVENFDIYLKLQVFLLGAFYIPGIILSLLNTREGMLKFLKVVICYVILPIIIIAELVVYIYMIKIIFVREIPNNQIFAIVTGMYIVALPVWIMIHSFSEGNKFIKYNSKIIPYSFIPLIFLQIYALALRIGENGITPQRYLGIVLIIIEIATVVLSVIKEQKYLKEILLGLIVLTAITMICPKINIIELSLQSQLIRLKSSYKEDDNFSMLRKQDKDTATSAFNYLKNNNIGKNMIPDYIDKEAIAKYDLEKYDYYMYDSDGFKNYYYNQIEEKEYSIDGYKSLKEIYIYRYYDQNTNQEIVNYDYEYDKNIEEDEILNALKDTMDRMIKEDSIESDFIKINENSAFVIKQCNIEYKEEFIRYLGISGYLLKK